MTYVSREAKNGAWVIFLHIKNKIILSCILLESPFWTHNTETISEVNSWHLNSLNGTPPDNQLVNTILRDSNVRKQPKLTFRLCLLKHSKTKQIRAKKKYSHIHLRYVDRNGKELAPFTGVSFSGMWQPTVLACQPLSEFLHGSTTSQETPPSQADWNIWSPQSRASHRPQAMAQINRLSRNFYSWCMLFVSISLYLNLPLRIVKRNCLNSLLGNLQMWDTIKL